MRPGCLWSPRSSTRNGSSGLKNRRAELPMRGAPSRCSRTMLAQFLQNEIGAGVVAAQQAAFEFADQQRTRLRRELAQVLPQPFDRVGARHRRLYPRLKSRGLIARRALRIH